MEADKDAMSFHSNKTDTSIYSTRICSKNNKG